MTALPHPAQLRPEFHPKTVRQIVLRDVRLFPEMWREGFSVKEVQDRIREKGHGSFTNSTVRNALHAMVGKGELVQFFRASRRPGRSWEGVPIAHFRGV